MSKPKKHYKKWRIRWVDETGKRHSAVYDDYKGAAHALKLRQIEVEEVKRGLRSPVPKRRSLVELCDYWEKHPAPKKRSFKDDVSILKSIRTHLGTLVLSEITAEHGDRYWAERSDLSPKTIRNHLTLLSTMLNLAVDLGWLHKAPKLRKPKFSLFETDYRWLRSQDEIARVLRAARAEGEDVHALYSSAVYTGMRNGELAMLQWADVSFERRLIFVQRSFSGPVKSARVRYVPILDPLLPILRQWRLRCPGEIVFPNRAGKVRCTPLITVAWQRLREWAKWCPYRVRPSRKAPAQSGAGCAGYSLVGLVDTGCSMALITYKQAAQRLGVKVGTLYALVAEKRIPLVRIGPRFVRFDPDELDRWVAQHRVTPGDQSSVSDLRDSQTQMPSNKEREGTNHGSVT